MNPQDIINKYRIDEEDIIVDSPKVSDDDSLCNNSVSSSVSAAPSALRKGKYSTNIININKNYSNPYSQHVYPSTSSTIYEGKKQNVKLNDRPFIHKFSKQANEYQSSKDYSILPTNCMLPNGVAVYNSGLIYGRCSRLSNLFRKKWKELVWVHCKPATILIFRSVDDSKKWMSSACLSNSDKKRLIKIVIDFDTMGVLTKTKKNSQNQGQHGYSYRTSKLNMTDVKSTRSKLDGSVVHKFFIERWSNSGSNIEASFCSSDVMDVKYMRKSIRKCIKKVTKPKSKNKDDEKSISMRSLGASSALSDVTNFTGVSATSYNVIEEEKSRFRPLKLKGRRRSIV